MGVLSFLSILLGHIILDIEGLLLVHSLHFWALLLTSIGLLQYSAIVLYPQADLLRLLVSWVSGSLWIWLGLSANIGHFDPSDIAALGLGVGNYYAFILNSTLLFKLWK